MLCPFFFFKRQQEFKITVSTGTFSCMFAQFVRWLECSSAMHTLFPIQHSELRHPPLHPNPSCRHVEPRWKLRFSPSPTHTHPQTHNSRERNGDVREDQGERSWEEQQNNMEEEERGRGIKKRRYSKPSVGAWKEERKEERRLGNSTLHPSPATTVRANISLLVLAGSSQAVRGRSGKLQRDGLTVSLSLSLIA